MPDRTVQQIIDAAFSKHGKKTISVADRAAALIEFQDMLSSWSIEGSIVPHYVTENFTLTIGQAIYTIGVTGDSPDLVTATGRPLRITDAYFRIDGLDYPIDVYMNKTEYNENSQKDLEIRPRRLYYDPQYPNGKIRFNYECEEAYDFHLISEKPLAEVTAITDTLSLPLGINRALVYNLTIGLADGLKNRISDDVRRIAKESKEIFEEYNSIEKLEGPVGLDCAITRDSNYRYGRDGKYGNINGGF
ncbi:MAG: hypothetical protein H8D23_38915 [Candidatus Brocadiales bacterium]|nr:hypothetical protein [Candidatus Brocadiales bacterium]